MGSINSVSLCMIIKNEKSNLPILLEQVCPVLEEIILVDTGSDDGTLEIIKKFQEKYSNIQLHNFNWIEDFSAARNFSFSLATQEWLFWLDGDDQVDTNSLLNFKKNQLLDADTDVWVLDYIYSRFENGTPMTTLGRERFLRRRINPQWTGAIHESIAIWSYRNKNSGDLKVNHNRAGKVLDHGRNIRILESEYAKNKNDARTAYYLGKELFDRVDPRGIEVLEDFLKLSGKYWDDEVNARSRLAFHYLSVKEHAKAINTANPIYHIDNTRRRAEFYYVYGQTEYDLQNWEVAIKWFEFCLLAPPDAPRVLNLEYFTWKPLRKIAECYKKLGQIEKTFEYANRVLQLQQNSMGSEAWYAEVTNFDAINTNKKIIEFEGDFRLFAHSKLLGSGISADFKVGVEKGIFPFLDKSINACVISEKTYKMLGLSKDMWLRSLLKKIADKGKIFWVLDSVDINEFPSAIFEKEMCSHLVDAMYLGRNVRVFVKADASLESIYNPPGQSVVSGPWRIRIRNLLRSAILAGHFVLKDPEEKADIVITQRWSPTLPLGAKFRIFDICEKLTKEDSWQYDPRCFSWANVVNVCSDELYRHIATLTDKKIIVVEDSFELSDDEWCMQAVSEVLSCV